MTEDKKSIGYSAQIYEFCEASLEDNPGIGLSLWLKPLSSRRILIAAQDIHIARDYVRLTYPDFEIDAVNLLGTAVVVTTAN